MQSDPNQEFTTLLKSATKQIKSVYFKLPLDGKPSVHRERVYCYELYHQLRVAWPNTEFAATNFVLNGEVDKSGHPRFQEEGLRRLKPDFLLHAPGHMSHNHTVIEVKSASFQKLGLLKDLTSLHRLSSMQQGYQRQILLIFGEASFSEIISIIEQFRHATSFKSPLELWSHPYAEQSAKLVKCWHWDDPKPECGAK